MQNKDKQIALDILSTQSDAVSTKSNTRGGAGIDTPRVTQPPDSPVTSFMGSEKSEDSEDDNLFETTPRFLRFLNWIAKWPVAARYVVYSVIGSGILMAPGLIDLFLGLNDDNESILRRTSKSATIAGSSLFSWSVFFAMSWSVFFVLDLAILIMPPIITALVRGLLGPFFVDLIAPNLVIFERVHTYLAFMFTSIVALAIRTASFNEQPVFRQILNCLLIISIVFVIEKLMLNLIAIRFHHEAYAKRLKEKNFFARVLDRLLAARRAIKLQRRGSFAQGSSHWKSKKTDGASTSQDDISVSETTSTHHRSAFELFDTGVKSSLKAVNQGLDRAGVGAVKEVVGDVTMAAISSLLYGGAAQTQIQSSEHARRMAGQIFRAFAYGRNTITVEDFYPYFERRKFAEQAFNVFDKEKNGDVSEEDFVMAILAYYYDSKMIDKGIKDLSKTVGKLDNVLMFIALIAIILLCCAVFGLDLQSYLLGAGSFILALSFVIGGSAKNLFDSIIFIFFYHPFDVGDYISIDDHIYMVSQMDLPITILLRTDGQEVYYANYLLAQKVISNFRRSPNQSDTVKVSLPVGASEEALEQLKKSVNEFSKENSRDYSSIGCGTFFEEAKYDSGMRSKIVLNFYINHRNNWQDLSLRSQRREKFMIHLKKTLVELKLYESTGGEAATS